MARPPGAPRRPPPAAPPPAPPGAAGPPPARGAPPAAPRRGGAPRPDEAEECHLHDAPDPRQPLRQAVGLGAQPVPEHEPQRQQRQHEGEVPGLAGDHQGAADPPGRQPPRRPPQARPQPRQRPAGHHSDQQPPADPPGKLQQRGRPGGSARQGQVQGHAESDHGHEVVQRSACQQRRGHAAVGPGAALQQLQHPGDDDRRGDRRHQEPEHGCSRPVQAQQPGRAQGRQQRVPEHRQEPQAQRQGTGGPQVVPAEADTGSEQHHREHRQPHRTRHVGEVEDLGRGGPERGRHRAAHQHAQQRRQPQGHGAAPEGEGDRDEQRRLEDQRHGGECSPRPRTGSRPIPRLGVYPGRGPCHLQPLEARP